MAKTIGTNLNFTDISQDDSGVLLNSNTATKIVDAIALPDQLFTNLTISNPSSQDVWIKFQAATVDNDKKGKILFKRSTYERPPLDVYHGEISAIAVNGSPTIFVSQY